MSEISFEAEEPILTQAQIQTANEAPAEIVIGEDAIYELYPATEPGVKLEFAEDEAIISAAERAASEEELTRVPDVEAVRAESITTMRAV